MGKLKDTIAAHTPDTEPTTTTDSKLSPSGSDTEISESSLHAHQMESHSNNKQQKKCCKIKRCLDTGQYIQAALPFLIAPFGALRLFGPYYLDCVWKGSGGR